MSSVPRLHVRDTRCPCTRNVTSDKDPIHRAASLLHRCLGKTPFVCVSQEMHMKMKSTLLEYLVNKIKYTRGVHLSVSNNVCKKKYFFVTQTKCELQILYFE